MAATEDLARSLARDHVANQVRPGQEEHEVHVVFFTDDADVARYCFRAARREDGTVHLI